MPRPWLPGNDCDRNDTVARASAPLLPACVRTSTPAPPLDARMDLLGLGALRHRRNA
jgi:hypothetical protein